METTWRASRWRRRGIALAVTACLGAVACGNATYNVTRDAAVSDITVVTDGSVGGPVAGPVDTHCAGPDGGLMTQTTSQASCTVDDAGGPPDPDAGPEYGATMYGTSGDDDDCKYHVVWSATPITENHDVTFTTTVTSLADGTPVVKPSTDTDPTHRVVIAEVFLNDTHPAPNSGQATTTVSPGVYGVGPIRFDAPGRWTVRFHIFENCADVLDDSPHGHAAFYVNVP